MTIEGERTAVCRPGARRWQSVPRAGAPMTAVAVWVQVRARPAAERPALIRAHLGRLAPQEVARLIALSAAATRLEVLERLARRDGAAPWTVRDVR